MKYFYLSRNALRDKNEVVLYDQFNMQVDIKIYRTGLGKEDAIEYIGENIPNDIYYDIDGDVVYSLSDRPSIYHKYILGTWVITDKEGYKKYCDEKVDEIKADILAYGFDYTVNESSHRQRCRDKDIAYMTSTITTLDIAKRILNIDKTVTWYFEDNVGVELDFNGMATLLLYGTSFVQCVFNAENFFKSGEAKLIDKDEFLEKVKELQQKELEVND